MASTEPSSRRCGSGQDNSRGMKSVDSLLVVATYSANPVSVRARTLPER